MTRPIFPLLAIMLADFIFFEKPLPDPEAFYQEPWPDIPLHYSWKAPR